MKADARGHALYMCISVQTTSTALKQFMKNGTSDSRETVK